MTYSSKSVTRVSQREHSKHGRKIIVTIGPGDTVSFRLQRSKKSTAAYLPFETLFDLAERKRAEALSGFDASPCVNPKKVRNV